MALTATFENDILTLTNDSGLAISGKIESGEFKFTSPLAGSDPLQEWPFLRFFDGGGHIEISEIGSLPASGLSIEVEDSTVLIHAA